MGIYGDIAPGKAWRSAIRGQTRIKFRLCSISDSSGSTTYTYQQNGLLASQTTLIGSNSYTTHWTYDAMRNRIASITYPDGNSVAYQYPGSAGIPPGVTGATVNIGGNTSTLASGIIYSRISGDSILIFCMLMRL